MPGPVYHPQQPWQVEPVISPILQMRKLRLSESGLSSKSLPLQMSLGCKL